MKNQEPHQEPFLPPTANGKPRRIPPPKLDPDTGCWIWQASKAGGYGKIGGPGCKPEWAHRVYYEIAYGPIPRRYQIHHICENRACVNALHMEALSPRKHGQKGTRAKLSITQVREIRRRLIEGVKGAELARQFGVTHNAICDIKYGKSWQDHVSCPVCNHKFDPYEFD